MHQPMVNVGYAGPGPDIEIFPAIFGKTDTANFEFTLYCNYITFSNLTLIKMIFNEI